MPTLLASRTQTMNMYEPAGAPVVVQENVELDEYACTRCQVCPPGASIQNW